LKPRGLGVEGGDLGRVVRRRLERVAKRASSSQVHRVGGFELARIGGVGENLSDRRRPAQRRLQAGEKLLGGEGEWAGHSQRFAAVARAKGLFDFAAAIEGPPQVFGHDDAKEPNAVPGSLNVTRNADHRWSEWTNRMDHRIGAGKKKAVEDQRLFKGGGVDGTRTRDPRRDRPVF
jgi:hypothetical protein